jgi:hypothetical protein
MNPQFPIYIVSKGRWESRLTMKTLDAMKTPYRVIIEEQEFDKYAAVINPKQLLILDPTYKTKFDTFSDLSQMGGDKGTGSGPARNFAWDHAASEGHKFHWTIDDNIRHFYRLNRNERIRVADGTIFRCMEDFCLRYKNIAMAGPQYFTFAHRKVALPPFILNTRIYSCNLIRTDLPFRWRGRYNEDTDLSLRMLKAKWCTVLFYAFLQGKCATQSVKGGNTDSIYKGGTLAKSRMLFAMHPDVTRVVKKYNRWHHHVDYTGFKKTRLIKDDVAHETGIQNYGMELRIAPGE